MTDRSIWSIRAEHALEQALDEVRGDIDAAVSLAMVCLRAEAGELSPGELEELEDGYSEPACTCPPDLLARGGFRSGCPEHSALLGPEGA